MTHSGQNKRNIKIELVANPPRPSFDLAQGSSCPGCESFVMRRIKELLGLAKQSFALASDTLNPEAKKALEEIGAKFAQNAEDLRRIEVTRAEYPKEKSR